MTRSISNAAAAEHNARAWDVLARQSAALTRPAADHEFSDPLRSLDPLGWLGPTIDHQRVLCLAAGGGRHGPLYAAAGGQVTVVDISSEMLALDRRVAAERNLPLNIVQTSMEDLSMFPPAAFDLVIHPVSTCYLPSIGPVYAQIARVLCGGGLYISQHKSPVSLQAAPKTNTANYEITVPYYRRDPLPPAAPGRIRESGTLEYLHRWEELLGGMCRAGFNIEDLVEPCHADPQAPPGTFAHRALHVAPYIRIKARRRGEPSRQVFHAATPANHQPPDAAAEPE